MSKTTEAQQAERISRLLETMSALSAALRPFGTVEIPDDMGDDEILVLSCSSSVARLGIPVGKFREAREVLKRGGWVR